MIVSEIFYGIKCNRCGEMYDDGEHSFWNDESSAFENASDSGWIKEKNKHYCNNCHEINDETDEVIVFEDYPTPLKTLNKFIDRVVIGSQRNVFETTTEFIVKFNFYTKTKLELFEENYIKNLLGENFISLECEVGKYNTHSCIIKIKK